MTLKKFIFFSLLFLFNISPLLAQDNKIEDYPHNYFQWPVAAAPALAANFGELRPNHYHMGLDCRTNQRENLPVFAAASGYVARVKIESFGFGRCLYINHPNGLTTLYAHLNDFNDAIEAYVKAEQYRQQKWKVDLEIPAGLLTVTKGQRIANSGNTGGSQGPHLHFEIRNTATDKVLNPLLFDMPIPDNIAPDIIRLAVYDRCKSTYEQSPRIVSLQKINGVYTPAGGNINVTTEKVSFAVTAYDRYSGSTNQNGIFQGLLYDNNVFKCGFRLNNISYAETRYLNAHIDYKTRSRGGPYLQHLSRLPGYPSGVYNHDESDGVITLVPGETHPILIKITDANGNSNKIVFNLKATRFDDKDERPKEGKEFMPGFVNIFETPDLKFFLPEKALYDSFYFQFKKINSNSGQPVYLLHNTSVPVHTYFDVKIAASFPQQYQDKIIMKRFYGSKDDYTAARPVQEANGQTWYQGSFREFGNFQLFIDTVPPVVVPSGFWDGINASGLRRIVFSVRDNAEDIKNFRATVDGQWLRFTNDKGRNFIYEFDEHCPKGSHTLEVNVEDLAGNITTKTYRFTR
ncbi:MAG: peptidoglycan DD-metalloendopeptidase family protein [Ferruginibacter sp.]